MSDHSTFIGVASGSDSVSTGSGDAGGQGVMTERVQALASSVYREFAQVVNQYGEGPVTSLMPIVITVLESLDGALSDLQDSQRALDEATDDNEQLHAQYEKEKQIRREEQAKRMRNEDHNEDERRDLKQQLDQIGTYNRQLKSQLNSTKDRADRGEEKNEKLKHEVVELQLKYRRATHMLQQQKNVSLVRPRTSSGARTLARTDSPASNLMDPAHVVEVTPFEIATRSEGMPTPMSSVEHGGGVMSATSRHHHVADELMDFQPHMASSPMSSDSDPHPLRSVISPIPVPSLATETSGNITEELQGVSEESPEPAEDSLAAHTSEGTLQEVQSPSPDEGVDDTVAERDKEDMATLSVTSSGAAEDEPLSNMGESLDVELMQASKSLEEVEVQEAIEEEEREQASPEDNEGDVQESAVEPDHSPVSVEEKTELPSPTAVPVQEAEVSSERDVTSEGDRQSIVSSDHLPQREVMEEMLSLRSDVSRTGSVNLQEMAIVSDTDDVSSQESVVLDIGADDLEIERLLGEVRHLEQASDQLKREKEEMASQLEQLLQERRLLQSRAESSQQERSEMQTKLRVLEADLQERTDRLEELEREEQANQEPLFPGAKDEENWTVAQKRQYSRVEMSRLLRERNEFKERYLSLKERLQILQQQLQQQQEGPSSKKKEKTLWKMFSDMFKGKAKSAPTPRGSVGKFTPLKTTDDEPVSSTPSTSSVPGALTLVGRRFEAYGWSLPEAMAPHSLQSSVASALPKAKAGEFNRLDTVPVLMHCGHLVTEPQDQMTSFSTTRTWCAAAVCSTVQSNPSLHPSDTVCPSSLMWVCTGTSELSRVNVLDANMPGEVIDSFPVCSSPILCIASVPGVVDDENIIHIASATEDSSVLTPTELDQYRYRSPQQSPPLQISPEHFTEAKGKGKSGKSAAGPVTHRNSPQEKVISLREAFQDSPKPTTRRDHSNSLSGEAMARPRLRLPTMWMGAEFGCLYIHSAVSCWRSCLHAMKVEASVLSIVYAEGKVFVAMANSSLAIFSRTDNEWDWEGYKVTYLGKDRDVPISVMVPVKHRVWCGVANKVYVVDARTSQVETHFKVHPSLRSRVLSLVTSGDGVWVSVRLDSTLRLFHADTFQNLQDVDVAKPIQTLLTFPGSKRKPSPRNLVRISTLLISNNCLWIGASNGTIISMPLTSERPVEGHETPRGTDVSASLLNSYSIVGEDVMATGADDSSMAVAVADGTSMLSFPSIPYLSLDASRLSFHGHIHNVDVLVATPGVMATRTVKVVTDGASTPKRVSSASVTFVMSVGGGYVDFRSDSTSPATAASQGAQSADRNHVIVWQVSPNNTDLL
eukprot:scpid10862/ scgid1805/ C-Jun-amino-terminal kinase-interacting protein 4; JNK-associated leucine-zipper protein; JNK/SAPK-associated protein 2; Mitogen-activated protein kinase 8-interacting protein 4; Sperm-associated antigen 9